MAPAVVQPEANIPVRSKGQTQEPIRTKGALDNIESFDLTPVIGREFPNAKLVDWLNAPNSDELLRDLAVTSKYKQPQHLSFDNWFSNQIYQSLSVELYSFVLKMISPMIYRRILFFVLAN